MHDRMYKCLKYCSFIQTVQLIAGRLYAINKNIRKLYSLFYLWDYIYIIFCKMAIGRESYIFVYTNSILFAKVNSHK